MEAKEMIELLKLGDIRVVDQSQVEYEIKHTCHDTTVYFWNGGNYSSYDKENEEKYAKLVERLSRIVRIEKEINSKYYPIWTKEDGLIPQNEYFVRLKG